MSTQKGKSKVCNACTKKTSCINRNSPLAKEDHSCFEVSQCFICGYRPYCDNPQKNNLPLASSECKLDANGVPSCFVEPTCKSCPLGFGHCKNSNLPDVVFTYRVGSPYPDCFSCNHSTK